MVRIQRRLATTPCILSVIIQDTPGLHCHLSVKLLIEEKMPFSDSVARHLRQPQGGIIGSAVKRFLKRNVFLAEKVVELSNIKPDSHVLEVGFGPGVALKKAASLIEMGKGRIYGIDFSSAMMIEAIKNLRQEIADEKVELILGNVANIPYRDNVMDAIYHNNCYYFWPDVPVVSRELLRVLKPGGTMISMLNLDRIKKCESKGYLKYAKWDPEVYMKVLRDVGFDKVQTKKNINNIGSLQSITALKPV